MLFPIIWPTVGMCIFKKTSGGLIRSIFFSFSENWKPVGSLHTHSRVHARTHIHIVCERNKSISLLTMTRPV